MNGGKQNNYARPAGVPPRRKGNPQEANRNGAAQHNRPAPGRNRPGDTRRRGPDVSRMTPEERARYYEYVRRRRAEREEAERIRRIEEERERKHREWLREKKKRQRIEKTKDILAFIAGLFIAAGVLVLIYLIVFGVLFVSSPDREKTGGKVTYYYGGHEYRTEDLENVSPDGIIRFCFNDLADYLNMAESGSANELKFILLHSETPPETSSGDGTEESISFGTDSSAVTVNGQSVRAESKNILKGEKVWVPLSIIEDYIENVSAVYDEREHSVKIAQVLDEEATEAMKTAAESDGRIKPVDIYREVSFVLQKTNPINHIEDETGGVIYSYENETVEFVLSLSEYEQYMNPDGDKRDSFLTVVNKDEPLSQTYVPDDLVAVNDTAINKDTQQLRAYAAKALEAMFKELRANGFYDMAVYLGYRSYSYQNSLFEGYANNEIAANPSLSRASAEAKVASYFDRAGTDDHQTGLSVDMDTLGAVTNDFAVTAEYAWLEENAWKFGFILRYPADKTEITGHAFESWHYRYVGRYHARRIHDSGMCLEEYVEAIN